MLFKDREINSQRVKRIESGCFWGSREWGEKLGTPFFKKITKLVELFDF